MFFDLMKYDNKFPPDSIEALSIDCVIFGFKDAKLHILLVEHGEGISKGQWGLPGGWIRYNESVDHSAHRVLDELTGVKDLFLEQLRAFGGTNRFPGKRVVTVAYYALIKEDDYDLVPGNNASAVSWFDVTQMPSIIYDHKEIIDFGFSELKYKVRREPIGFNLLPKLFTLLQLQSLYEAILEQKLDKPNFRRKMLKMNLLIDTGEKQQNVSHRAANLYRFDEQVYQRLKDKGFNFEY